MSVLYVLGSWQQPFKHEDYFIDPTHPQLSVRTSDTGDADGAQAGESRYSTYQAQVKRKIRALARRARWPDFELDDMTPDEAGSTERQAYGAPMTHGGISVPRLHAM